MPGDDDHLRLGFQGMDLFQHFKPIPIGQPDVQQHHIVGRVADQRQAFVAGGRSRHRIGLFAKDLFERLANLGFVIDDQDVVHEEAIVADGESQGATSGSGVSLAPAPFPLAGDWPFAATWPLPACPLECPVAIPIGARTSALGALNDAFNAGLSASGNSSTNLAP